MTISYYIHMQATVRTTIRIRKDLFEHSRRLAFERGTSLQDVVNIALERGFRNSSDVNRHIQAMCTIDTIREKLGRTRSIDVQALVRANKKELQERDNRRIPA